MKVYHTEQRKSILDYLESRQDACVTAGEVAAALSAAVSKSAVYRNLADLEKEGKVVRVSTHGGRSAGYRYAASHACAGRIHISCVKCGKTEHVSSAAALRLERALAMEEGFSLNKGESHLYGICKECREGGNK
ncbi:MAG: transcriptional repressor [Clostridia bacterium]|nr:transcriptional repressor [Clostridia bacterium]